MADEERQINTDPAAANSHVGPERLHLPGVELEALRAWLVEQRQPRYRAEQIAVWLYAKGAESFQAMSNLAKPLRAWLAEHADLYRARVAADNASSDGTHKLLLTKYSADPPPVPVESVHTVMHPPCAMVR